MVRATDDLPDPEDLVPDLKAIVRTGLSVSRLKNLPTLFNLAVVATESRGNRPLDRAIGLERVLREAVDQLGDGPTGDAVRLLLGMTPRSRGLLVKERRDLAAEHLGIEAETFRKGWEAQLLAELADELYKLESERRIPIRVKGRERSGPILDDVRNGTSGKSLDRREAEARLWAVMYELRADLLAVARLQEDRPGDDAWLADADSALSLFARFADTMARFVDEYGSAFVMAGNEVTIDEAVSLLGWRPPFGDDDLARLRLAHNSTPEHGATRPMFDDRTRQRWVEWLRQS